MSDIYFWLAAILDITQNKAQKPTLAKNISNTLNRTLATSAAGTLLTLANVRNPAINSAGLISPN